MKNRWSVESIILLIVACLLTLVASFYFDLIVNAIAEDWAYTTWLKAGILALSALALLFFEKGSKPITKFAVILFAIVLSTLLNEYLQTLQWVNAFTNSNTFLKSVGGNVLLKLFSAVIITLFMLAVFRKPAEVYLVPGNLKVKAEPVKFLGISKNWVSWGKLALISGVLISVVTMGLSILSVAFDGFHLYFSNLLELLPLIILFALFNSFCEGIMCRNAVVGPLTKALPKEVVLLLSGLYFGSFHYYGVPSGIIGVIMASFLGWFLARSMFETKGFLAPWMIHFLQDFAIFLTLVLLGAYSV